MSLIVLEGIDISGKRTQTELLVNRLKTMRRKVKCIAFPDYNTLLGREIGRYLQEKVRFRPEVLQLLYVANRWERERDIYSWLNEGFNVIADRYIPSGLAYGLANNLPLEWILKLEDGLPVAEMVVVIDTPVKIALKREAPKDVYEKDRPFQERVRRSYLDLAERFGWVLINGNQPINEIAEQIWVYVSKVVSNI